MPYLLQTLLDGSAHQIFISDCYCNRVTVEESLPFFFLLILPSPICCSFSFFNIILISLSNILLKIVFVKNLQVIGWFSMMIPIGF